MRVNAMLESFVNLLTEVGYTESCVKVLTFLSGIVDKFLQCRVL